MVLQKSNVLNELDPVVKQIIQRLSDISKVLRFMFNRRKISSKILTKDIIYISDKQTYIGKVK